MKTQVISAKRSFSLKIFNFASVLFIIILSSEVCFAQKVEPVFRRYTVNDGLPSSTVYHAFQDSKGYIWFATANGVSRFDGYKFENFDIQSGLVDNDVFEIYEDYKHRIWFIPMSGKLCYYEDGKIVPYIYNDVIVRNIKKSRGPVKGSFFVDKQDFVYMSIRFSHRFCISPEGVFSVFINSFKYGIEAVEIYKGKILTSFSASPFSKNVKFDGIENDFEISLEMVSARQTVTPLHLFFVSMPDSSTVMTLSKKLVSVKGNKIIKRRSYGEEIIWASCDTEGNLWVSPISGGVQYLDGKRLDDKPIMSLLENFKVTSVLHDYEGAYWFTTLNDGVFYCPSIYFLKYKGSLGFSDSRINAVVATKEGIYLGYEFAFVDLLHDGKIKHYLSPKADVPKNTVRSFLDDSTNSRLWVCSIVNLNWIENGTVNKIGLSPTYKVVFPKKIVRSRSEGYWIASTKGLVKYCDDKVVYESYVNNQFNELVYDLAEDFNQTVWLCTVNGIWSYQNETYKFWGEEDPRLGQTSYCMLINPKDSSLWIGTNGAGIVIKKGNEISQITTKDGLASNSISQLYFADNNVWVATRNGLSRIIIDRDKFVIKNFSNANGLPTNEVTSVCEFRDSVFVGTTQGLAVFNKYRVEECLTPPKIVISKLTVNDKNVDLTIPNLSLLYNQNSLSIDFVGFVYRNNGKVNYRYRMLGVDSSWVYTHTPNCQYNGLLNGKYKFEVEAQSYNGVWSNMPAPVEFTIRPPFWKRIWFLSLSVILFSGIIFLFYRIRINSINKRNELVQNINLYKQQSLRQQMNPHFIFNTLNSIQLYILEKDSISSHKYLTKFARLMRLTLDNSMFSSIPVKDELEALRIYLDLEKLRVEDRFDYLIDYGDDENILKYGIPTLLIQPFVENAIWHGISLRNDQLGWVKIMIREENNLLKCIVEDNGVGRVAAYQIRQSRSKEHKSRGSQITQQRIDLLSQMYQADFSIVYVDLYDSEGNASGTRVVITVPKNIKVYVDKNMF